MPTGSSTSAFATSGNDGRFRMVNFELPAPGTSLSTSGSAQATGFWAQDQNVAFATGQTVDITIDMLLRAADAIAHVVRDEELNPNFIIPTVFNAEVPKAVA